MQVKDVIKEKSFIWNNIFKINIKTVLTSDLRIGFADESFDKKHHNYEEKVLINYMPAIWRKNKIISIPFLDKRKKLSQAVLLLKSRNLTSIRH